MDELPEVRRELFPADLDTAVVAGEALAAGDYVNVAHIREDGTVVLAAGSPFDVLDVMPDLARALGVDVP